ncbi:MAG: hypothetical protein LRZ84_22085 [Desertifilum sp.]|nr:hypothetical protein [Desertifilum sp.]
MSPSPPRVSNGILGKDRVNTWLTDNQDSRVGLRYETQPWLLLSDANAHPP